MCRGTRSTHPSGAPAALLSCRETRPQPRGTTLTSDGPNGATTTPPQPDPPGGSGAASSESGAPASSGPGTGGPTGGSEPLPGLREQIGRLVGAIRELGRAHWSLLRAEIDDILDEVKRIALLAGMAVALLLFLAGLSTIGLTLFLGEWLFGSIGWGIVHGTLLVLALVLSLGLLALDAPSSLVTRSLLGGLVIGVVVGVVLGFNVPRHLAEWGSDQLRAGPLPNLDPGWGPAVVGVVVGAIVLGIILLAAGARAGGGAGGIGGLVGGAVLGALVGWWLGGLTFSAQGAAALALCAWFAGWMALMGAGALRAGIDPVARFKRLWPQQSYDAAMETRAWAEAEWAKRRGRLGNR